MSSGHHHNLYLPGSSPLHRLAPEAKLVAAFAFVFAVAITPRRAVPAFLVDAAVVAGVMMLARFGLRQALTRLAAVLPFITFAVFIPFIAGGDTTEVLGLSLSTEGLWGSWNVVAKATIGAGVSAIVASTTRVNDIVRGLSRLRVPTAITAVVSFMFRYLDVIVEEMGRTRVAMTSRGHDPRWLWQAKPIAASAGALFIRSYERGERVHAAMVSRGFTGTMPDLDSARAGRRDWALAALAPLVALAAAAWGITR